MAPGIVGESDLNGNLTSEYVFFGGRRVARRDNPNGTSSVLYYFSDHLNTTDIVTNAQGTILNESDYYPWGGEVQFANGDSNHYKFTGKERDSESQLDYFGARYYSNGLGRFLSVDPVVATPLRAINPQRWNLYSYVSNRPLVLIDPDGKDAVYVNFSGMAHGFGHAGVLSIHREGAAQGSATYSRFGPASQGSAVGTGQVQTDHEIPTVQFGPNGLPTPESLKALIQAVAQYENVDPSTVRIDYFQTSEDDTWLLDEYILDQQAQSDAGNAKTYCFKGQNCADYAIAGLVAGHAIDQWRVGFMPPTPNQIFFFLQGLADFSIGVPKSEDKPKEKVTHRFCQDGKCFQL